METLNLVKGQRVDLTKTNPGLKAIALGLGWDVRNGAGDAFDLDAFAVALKDGKLDDVVYFNHKTAYSGAINHSGDNLTGEGAGDDETIVMLLDKIPAGVTEVMVCVNIYQAASRRQNFGQVQNAFIRVYDKDTNTELAKYDLSEDYSAFNGMVMGKIYLKDSEWKFQAVGEGVNGSIVEIADKWA